MIFVFTETLFCILGSYCDASILVLLYVIDKFVKLIKWRVSNKLLVTEDSCGDTVSLHFMARPWGARTIVLAYISPSRDQQDNQWQESSDCCSLQVDLTIVKRKKTYIKLSRIRSILKMANKLIFCIFNQFKQLSMWV